MRSEDSFFVRGWKFCTGPVRSEVSKFLLILVRGPDSGPVLVPIVSGPWILTLSQIRVKETDSTLG